MPSLEKYQVTVKPFKGAARAKLGEKIIAESEGCMVLYETGCPPCLYFPRTSILDGDLKESAKVSFCPFKGNANHFHLEVDKQSHEDLIWSYETALNESREISGYISFYPDRVNVETEVDLNAQLPVSGAFIPDSLINWAVLKAPSFSSLDELVSSYVDEIRAFHGDLCHIRVLVQTLHPQLLGLGFKWTDDGHGLEYFDVDDHILNNPVFTNSPLKEVVFKKGGVRVQLEKNPNLDAYPILKDFSEMGVTDYCALPLIFSSGHHNVLSIATRSPGGYTTADLGSIYQSLGLFGAILEKHIANRNMDTFLQTYLGSLSSQKLLAGKTKRGDGDEIRAVIVYSDLRNSTQLINELNHLDFLEVLNEYFDAIADAIISEDGEILQYIGDAVLGFFPITDPNDLDKVCLAAERAVEKAFTSLEEVNDRFANKEGYPIACGVALHLGKCVYGNIGTKDRLAFTSIGPCVNKTVRLESLCKSEGGPFLVSKEFAEASQNEYSLIGMRAIKGFKDEVEVYGKSLDSLKLVG